MSLASYQLLHSAMFIVLRVQRYYLFFKYANFHESFFLFDTFPAKKFGYFK